MKRILQHAGLFTIFSLFLAFTMPAQAQDYGSGIVQEVPQVDPGDLVMDGVADEAAWENAPVVNMVANWSGAWSDHPDPDVQAAAKLLWSEDTLYVFALIQDYQELYFGQPGQAWQGEQILIGVDGTHTMDSETDDTYAGWPDQGPDSLTVYKVTSPEQGGITSNWASTPVDTGWVNGAVLVDDEAFTWQVETAIYVPQIEEGEMIGFNVGGATAGMDYAEQNADSLGNPGDGAYAYFAWSAVMDAGLAVQNNSSNYATLSLVQSVAIEETPGSGIPGAFALHANYPNPFAQAATIKYDMAEPGHVSLAVYDVLGREVTTLVDDKRAANTYRVRWTPESRLSSGIYFYQLRVDDQLIATRRVTLLR